MRTISRGAGGTLLAWVLLVLAACGGGGGGSSAPPPAATASVAYASATQTYTIGTAITPLTPTITGSLTSFSVSPALPAGLSLNTGTGVISGTPTAVAATANYTVYGMGSGVSTVTTTLSITVNDVAPTVAYSATSFTYTVGEAGSTLTPTSTGGAAISWSINPALPQGLTFSATDGSISGAPTAVAASASYTVTARNSGGTGTVALTIAANASPLMHLGHQGSVVFVRTTATRVLTADKVGNWILWDYAGASLIAAGNSGCVPSGGSDAQCPSNSTYIDMAGTTAVIATATGFEFRSTTDGHVLGTIVLPTVNYQYAQWWKLASDGSYLAAGGTAGVAAWSNTGQQLFSNSGSYGNAGVFAAPGQLLVGAGAAGANVIETIAVPGGTSTTGPQFNGTFSSWFTDGSRFITTASSTALIYSNPGTQAQAQAGSITGLTGTPVGQGNWVWTLPSSASGSTPLSIYPAAGTNTTPAASYTFGGVTVQAIASGTTIGVTTNGATAGTEAVSSISVIDLSGATPAETNYTANLIAYDSVTGAPPYAAVSATQWVVGDLRGLVVDGTTLTGAPRYFGWGEVLGIAAGSGHFAVATASGTILYFNSATLAQEGQIQFAATTLRMSADGTLLAAVGDPTFNGNDSVQIYSLPAGGAPLYTWPYSDSGSTPMIVQDIELSGSGNLLAQVVGELQVSAPTGGTPILTATGAGAASLSPDGTLVAYAQGYGTNLWQNGTLVTAFSEVAVGWLDNSRLLVDDWDTTLSPSHMSPTYSGCTIYEANGTPTASACALPMSLSRIQPVTSDWVYAPQLNEILSVSTGTGNWASGNPLVSVSVPGAVAGSNVIFSSGIDLLAQEYQ